MIPPALARAPLACPHDGLALAPGPDGLRCAAGHNFDVSRRGYADLLPLRWKPSRAPGDDAAMVAARRRVLDAGLFEPVADAVLAAVREALPDLDEAPAALVDAGCGEGWYTARLRAALRDPVDGPGTRIGAFVGTDISKPAVTLAARRDADVAWAVANNVRLPVLRGAAGIVTSLFGFETWEPWALLQRRGQRVIVASAGPDHLVELRALVYDEVRRHGAPDDGAARQAGYARVKEVRVHGARHCTGLGGDVLAMTPHAHRTRAGGTLAGRLAGLDTLTLDVVVRAYRRERGGGTAAAGPLD